MEIMRGRRKKGERERKEGKKKKRINIRTKDREGWNMLGDGKKKTTDRQTDIKDGRTTEELKMEKRSRRGDHGGTITEAITSIKGRGR